MNMTLAGTFDLDEAAKSLVIARILGVGWCWMNKDILRDEVKRDLARMVDNRAEHGGSDG